MIITISGTAGSGKSTVAKNVAALLRAERIYVGGIRRELARKMGMSIRELNEYGKTHPETDVDVDKEASSQAKSLEKKGRKVVVEGRIQFHFIPDSIKIFMKVNAKEAAKRIWKDLQDKKRSLERNEGKFTSLKEVEKSLIERDAADAQRYIKYYNIDHRDESQYDLVVDTTHISAEQAAKRVLRFIDESSK